MNKNKVLISLSLFINISLLGSFAFSRQGQEESIAMGVVASMPAFLVAMAWQAYTYPLVPLGEIPTVMTEDMDITWDIHMGLDLSFTIPLQRAFAIGLIVKLSLDAYDIYRDWIDYKARQLRKMQKEQEEKEIFAAELKYTADRTAIERDLIEQIKKTLRDLIDLKIVESEVFPTRKTKIFVLQNIKDFFTFEHKPELNLFVYQVATQMINDLQRDLLLNKSTNQEIVIDTYRDYYVEKQSKPFAKMSIAELTAVKKDFEAIVKSNRAVASANIREDNSEYEKAIHELMEESIAAEQKMESAEQTFKLTLPVILEATALTSLITHIEFMLDMQEQPKEKIFGERELMQAEELQARKSKEQFPLRKEQYQTIAAALKAKGTQFTPIAKRKFPQPKATQIPPLQKQEIQLSIQEQQAPITEQQNKPWYSKFFTWSYWFGNK